jgi:hypothetical protein
MKLKALAAPMAAIAALAMVGTLPAAAQPPGWDRNAFWHGAPADPYQRIDFLQRRIRHGIDDGSLSPHEARRAQYQLDRIRRDADRMRWRHHGNFSRADYDYIQGRLDDLSQRIRWQRQNWSSGYGEQRPGAYGSNYSGNYGGNYVTTYDASRYYRDGPNYSERRLSDNDEVYRGSDGRYYCKRGDGTTGLIVGAAAGGILGNIIDGGHKRTAGTLIGGALGALAGKSIAENQDIRCR